MQTIVSKTITLLAFSFILFSCTKEEEKEMVIPVTSLTVFNLPADTVTGLGADGRPKSASTITYYSLENKSLVAASDSLTTKWDIAFSQSKIFVNGGTNRAGNGGAFTFIGTFEGLTKISTDSVFKRDNPPTSFAIPQAAVSTNALGWYNYNPVTQLLTPEAGRVLVIKTASGKYAKVEILNYYKDSPSATILNAFSTTEKLYKQRYYTFRYSFQPNGSLSF